MQESSETRNPPLVPTGIAKMSAEERPVLLGGRCQACDRIFFPRPQFCPHCLGPVEECEIKGEGAIYSHTAVRARPPLGLPQPYAVGFIDLDQEGLRIFALLDPEAVDRLSLGARVALAVGSLGNDAAGRPCLRPYFRLAESEAEHA
jgi:uncharacterized OB-fold protein